MCVGMLLCHFGEDDILEAYTVLNRPIVKQLPFFVISFGDFDCSADYFTERSEEPSCLLLYTLKGGGVLKYQDEEMIIPENCVAAIDCRRYQYYAPAKDDRWHFAWMHFAGKCAVTYVDMMNENGLTVLDLSHRPDFHQYFHQLSELEKSVDKNRELMFSSLVNEMLTELILYRQRSISEQKYAEHLPGIEQAIAYITAHYHEPITVDRLAYVSNISKYYFIKIFRCITGNTPYTFLTLYRIKQAKHLLESTEMTVGDIAHATGFSDAKNFIASFKKYSGITPLQFRKTPKI